ncbi:MAG: CC0125/CC1285 family lipoprotein [Geminicoccaceae bacterium]
MKRPFRDLQTAMLLATCLVVVGCSKPTYYRPASNGYGYAERQLAEGRYQVVFAGNHKTRREQAHQYVLFRAAELADQKGYRYVAVNDQSQRIEFFGSLRDRPTQRVDLRLDNGNSTSGSNRRNDDDGLRSTVERYQAILDVSFYKDEESVPAAAREVYTTDEVLKDLGDAIEFESGPPSGDYIINRVGS